MDHAPNRGTIQPLADNHILRVKLVGKHHAKLIPLRISRFLLFQGLDEAEQTCQSFVRPASHERTAADIACVMTANVPGVTHPRCAQSDYESLLQKRSMCCRAASGLAGAETGECP
jgi:hypothetical protein